MVNDDIKVTTEYIEYSDKKDLALVIRDSTFYSELGCSLLNEGIRMDCEGCIFAYHAISHANTVLNKEDIEQNAII